MKEHTPTPWIYKRFKGVNFLGTQPNIITSNESIGEIYEPSDARYIIHCINSHEALVEALKECINSLDVYVNGNNPNSLYKDGKHSCYVMGSTEALNKAKQTVMKASE